MMQVDNPLYFSDDTMSVSDELKFDIPDDDLVQIINERKNQDEKFYESRYRLRERRRKNERFLWGRQLEDQLREGTLKSYETRNSDNVIYQIEASLKPLALSKFPDIIVTPGVEGEEQEKSAKDLTTVLDDTNKKRESREVLGLAFKHLPVYFTSVTMARWDPNKGKAGDFRFDVIPPEYVIVDHTCQTRDVDDMSHIMRCVPMSVRNLLMKFPKKKKEIIEELGKNGVCLTDKPTWKDMESEVKVWEIWFDWYRRKGSKQMMTKSEADVLDPEGDWEVVAGVCWKYENCILEKMLDPNYDWQGENKYFSYGDMSDETSKIEVDDTSMMMSAITGAEIPNLQEEQIFHNYFQRPHKPFYFMGYDQWGKTYLDETSRIEQNLRNQENLDSQEKTMLDQLKTRIKHIWSKDSGMRKEDIQRLDMDDPKMDALVQGNPNNVHKAIAPERPDAAQFNAAEKSRSNMFAIAGASAIQGQIQSQVATTNQIAREADFTRSDDLVESTINAACEWMARWQLQFIKLRYTEEHMVEVIGSRGKATYIKLKRDVVSDGMEVRIKASSTDKLKAQRNALDMAKLGPPFTNPLDLFKDVDMSDPEGRTERGMLFAMDPQGYFTKYILNLEGTQEQAAAITAGLPPAPVEGAPPVDPMSQPPPMAPQNPTPTDTSQIPTQQPAFPEGSPRAL